jgi:hypothetical protein
MMKYLEEIRVAHQDPEELESLYQAALRDGEGDQFAAAILACNRESPDNILFAAWYYRLQQFDHRDELIERRSVNWRLAVPLGALTGLVFWIASNPSFDLPRYTPYLALVWALVVACSVIAFLTITAGKEWRSALSIIAGLVGVGIYVTLVLVLRERPYYQDLMLLHLPVLAWAGAGLSVLGWRSDYRDRFAFLIKSLEVFVTGGLFLMAGAAFGGITIGMFAALGITPSEEVMRFLAAGGSGLIPVLAVAAAYDPSVCPLEQRFREGLSKLIFTLMQLLLPLTLLVLVVYLFVIPFNFMEPFRNREVLIVYNVMLFAIMGLLVGVTPVRAGGLSPRHQRGLRAGVLAVAILAVIVSLYAMSATVYRTVQGGITVNRLTVIGWNTINIGILVLLVTRLFKDGPTEWVRSAQWTFSRGATVYLIWTSFLVVAIPWLFGG